MIFRLQSIIKIIQSAYSKDATQLKRWQLLFHIFCFVSVSEVNTVVGKTYIKYMSNTKFLGKKCYLLVVCDEDNL